MRIIRTVITGLLVALLGLSAFAAAPVQAEQADRALPKRTISEKPPAEHQISYDTFKLTGVVTELQIDGITFLPYAKKKVQLQKKACPKKSCKWKTVKQVKTNAKGRYKTKIFAPRSGRWKWRVKVKGSKGFGTTKGETWTVFFK